MTFYKNRNTVRYQVFLFKFWNCRIVFFDEGFLFVVILNKN